MSKPVSPELQERMLEYVAHSGLPLGHSYLVAVDHEGFDSDHGDVGLRGRAIECARRLKQRGDYEHVFLINFNQAGEAVLYEYDGALIAVSAEPDLPPFTQPGPRIRPSALAERLAA